LLVLVCCVRSQTTYNVSVGVDATTIDSYTTGTNMQDNFGPAFSANFFNLGCTTCTTIQNMTIGFGDIISFKFGFFNHTVTFVPVSTTVPALFGAQFKVSPYISSLNSCGGLCQVTNSSIVSSGYANVTSYPYGWNVTFTSMGTFLFYDLLHWSSKGNHGLTAVIEVVPVVNLPTNNAATIVAGQQTIANSFTSQFSTLTTQNNALQSQLNYITFSNGTRMYNVQMSIAPKNGIVYERFIPSNLNIHTGDFIKFIPYDNDLHLVMVSNQNGARFTSNYPGLFIIGTDGSWTLNVDVGIAQSTDTEHNGWAGFDGVNLVYSGLLLNSTADCSDYSCINIFTFIVQFTQPGTFGFVDGIRDTNGFRGFVTVSASTTFTTLSLSFLFTLLFFANILTNNSF